MASAKEKVRQILSRLPADCTLEDVQYQLYVAETIKQRLESASRMRLLSHVQAKRRLRRWITN